MNKNQLIKAILIFSIVLCLILGGFGYYSSTKKVSNTNKNDNNKYNITMLYYLNGTQKLTSIPENPKEEVLYKFEKYICTNKVKGTWDDKNWKFNIDETANATCKLYFVSAQHNVTINVLNGVLDENSITKVVSNEDGTFKLTANEGYVYDSTTCANNEEVLWDETKSELTVKSVKLDTTCDVSFKLKEYTVEISVTNGKNVANQTIKHNQTLTATITPSSGFGTPKITCNNTELGLNVTPGTWENNIYTMNSITSNIKCVIEFKAIEIPPVLYTVTFKEILNGTIFNTKEDHVEEHKSTSYTITNEYEIDRVYKCDYVLDSPTKITVKNVTSNVECEINIK